MAENTNIDDLLARWLSNELTPEEEKKLAEKHDLTRLKKIVGAVDNLELPDFDLESFREGIQEKKGSGAKFVELKPSKSKIIFRIAASVALLIGVALGVIYMNGGSEIVTYTAAAGETKDVKLPDGSTVKLNCNSSISFSEDNWEDGRKVNLDGTAFFKVTKGNKFSVDFEKGSVEVLGTQFEIDEDESFFSVKCYEGKVRTSTKNGQKTILTKGKATKYLNGGLVAFEITGEGPGWITGIYKYDSVPMIHVIKHLEAQYEIKVIKGDVNLNFSFVGAFPSDNLDRALGAVFRPYSISFRVEGKKVYLSK